MTDDKLLEELCIEADADYQAGRVGQANLKRTAAVRIRALRGALEPFASEVSLHDTEPEWAPGAPGEELFDLYQCTTRHFLEAARALEDPDNAG